MALTNNTTQPPPPIEKYLNPKADIAFKRIFGLEKNEDILIAMLNSVLEGQLCSSIKKVEFLPTFQEPEVAAKKQSVVDVLCRDSDGCQYIIEMQLAESKHFVERAQYYASKAFISQMAKGEQYEDLKEVIFLAFTNFPIFAKKEAYKSEHVTLDKATQERDLDRISFTFVDLVKFDEQCKGKALDSLTLEEKFYYFLVHADSIERDELKQLVKDKAIKHAFRELERYSWSKEDLIRYASDA